MRKLLSSPANMSLSDAENQIYQNALKFAAELSLNLMAVKVNNRPEDFLGWCVELSSLCKNGLNLELLDPPQLRPLKKLQESLEAGISIAQLKMARIAPWAIVAGFIESQSSLQALEERLRLLDYVDGLRTTPLAELNEEDRLVIAGKHSPLHDPAVYTFDVEWFASTKGAKTFHLLLKQQPAAFDEALAHIPLEGEITSAEYRAFVTAYQAIFATYSDGEAGPLAAATRLLAMRRPDQFIALTNAKIDVLCQGMAIAKFNSRDFDAYWKDMIGTVRSYAWWRQPAPESPAELKLWQARALLVDMFLFADEDTAAGSNYLRLRDKPKKAGRSGATRSTPRTKASAEALVDKALAADDMPAYLLEKRESIINEVKGGKSVDQVIGLMRAIFG